MSGANASPIGRSKQAMTPSAPPLVEVIGISKSFGSVRALDAVNLTVRPASFHAVIGENGAGKSTLAKCILGFYQADEGEIRLNGTSAGTTVETRAAGVGMVFQHFTLVPSMTVAENLAVAQQDLPAILNWRREQERLAKFLQHAPFGIDLNRRVAHLAAGEKQKVEILKQLYLETKVLILDEPTSALTPAESNEVMGILSAMVRRGLLTVILITHKLREVMSFANELTVLRRGRFVASVPVSQTSPAEMAELMIGEAQPPEIVEKRRSARGEPAFELRQLTVRRDNGTIAVQQANLVLYCGEILGIAGVSGNGQREMIEAIGGQRTINGGEICAFGKPFRPTRRGIRETGLLTLPEEPLQNATVPSMTVAENLALRNFDEPPLAKGRWFLNPQRIKDAAAAAIRRFSVRPPSPDLPIRSLSGGNVQRTVLARDLGNASARIMVTANPCVGLDFAATAFVHNHLVELRNGGGSVLLVSEDLDELTKLCDRILVMSEGKIVHETRRAEMDLALVGRYMGGHTHSALPQVNS